MITNKGTTRGATSKISSKHGRVRLLRQWGAHRKGDEISPPGALRTELLRNGAAEEIESEVKQDAEPKRGRRKKKQADEAE